MQHSWGAEPGAWGKNVFKLDVSGLIGEGMELQSTKEEDSPLLTRHGSSKGKGEIRRDRGISQEIL